MIEFRQKMINTCVSSGIPWMTSDGLFNKYRDCPHDDDLMMLPEKKEGWINVYKERCYETKEEAIRHIAPGTHYIDTIRVEWEDKE